MKRIFIILVILIITSSGINSQINISHVEPPNWWAGMANSNLQLMIRGENISQYAINIDVTGIELKEVIKPENPNYLFINLMINDDIKPGKFEIEFIKDGVKKGVHLYDILPRREFPQKNKGFSSRDIIYLLMPDRFANGDESNDNQVGMKEKADRSNPDGRHGGDIKGVIDHLDYIKDLGMSAIWVTPVQLQFG